MAWTKVTDVTSFLREIRRSLRDGAEQLEELHQHCDAVARRLQGMRENLANVRAEDVLEEMHVRDEVLRATAKELSLQLELARQAVAMLETERAKYLDLFDQSPEAYLVTDMGGVIEEANAAAGSLFRTQTSFLKGRSLITFVARQDTRAFRSFLDRIPEPTGAEPARAALRMRPRGQPAFVTSVWARAITSGAERPRAIRWSLRPFDLSEHES
jgi:PAS domain-containing protein